MNTGYFLAVVTGALVSWFIVRRWLKADTLEARSFIVTGDSGQVRAAIGTLPDGSVGFDLFDTTGTLRCALHLDSEGSPIFDFYDSECSTRLRVCLTNLPSRGQGLPCIHLLDNQGNTRALFTCALGPSLSFYGEKMQQLGEFATTDSQAVLCLNDQQGTPRVLVATNEDGSGLTLHNRQGNVRVWLGDGESGAHLTLFKKEDGEHLRLAIGSEGPMLGFFDNKGTARLGIRLTESEPNLMFYDANGASRAMLYGTFNGPTLAFLNKDGEPRALFWGKEEQAGLAVGLGRTSHGISLKTRREGATLAIVGKNGEPIFKAP